MIAACAVTMVLAAGEFVAPAESSEPTSAIVANQTGDGRIEVLAQGEGPVIVLLPSLGRSASDFDAIAVQLASAGYRVLRPQPRGIGRSVAPLTGITLHDYAADVAIVIEQERMGPAFVVGHAAFGSRVARLLAADRPELVTAVAMVAADAGGSPTVPKLREAINTSANLALPDDERIEALQFAFFAPGNDASAWLQGWYPAALRAEQRAGELTPR
ncbi:MAG: alpha/beta fold hydrolase, partial [Pseudolabrys sp.]